MHRLLCQKVKYQGHVVIKCAAGVGMHVIRLLKFSGLHITRNALQNLVCSPPGLTVFSLANSRETNSTSLAICRPSGCTVASGVVGVGVVVVVVVCNRSQMRTSRCTCIVFGVSIGLDPGYRNAHKEFLIGQSSRSHATYRRPSLGGF